MEYWTWPMVLTVVVICVLTAACLLVGLPASAEGDVPSYVTERLAERHGLEVGLEAAEGAVAMVDSPTLPPSVVAWECRERTLSRDERLVFLIEKDAEIASRIVAVVGAYAPWSDDAFRYEVAFAIARACRQWEVSPELVCALVKVESGYNPRAVSPTNDHGLMQLHGRPIYGIEENISAGVAHLGAAISAEGSERAGLARYNGGPGKPGVSWQYADRILGMAGDDR